MKILKTSRLYMLILATSVCFTVESITVLAVPLDQSGSTCPSLFESEASVFRSAFYVVPPEPYLRMCLQDNANGNSDDACRVAAAYHQEARRREVHLRMPGHCVTSE